MIVDDGKDRVSDGFHPSSTEEEKDTPHTTSMHIIITVKLEFIPTNQQSNQHTYVHTYISHSFNHHSINYSFIDALFEAHVGNTFLQGLGGGSVFVEADNVVMRRNRIQIVKRTKFSLKKAKEKELGFYSGSKKGGEETLGK